MSTVVHPGAAPPPLRRRPKVPSSNLELGWLALPAALVLLALFAVPMGAVLVSSFGTSVSGQIGTEGFTLSNYAEVMTSPLYQAVILRTLRISLTVTLVSLVMAYPVALAMSFGPDWCRRVLLVAVICPIMISAVVRSYGWILVLGLDGPLNQLMMAVGVIDRPAKMVFNELGVTIGLIHVYLPFMILPLSSVLSKLDVRLIEAARVMGAGSFTVFTRVIVPASLSGLAAGSVLVFTLSAGALVTPGLLGGSSFNLLAPLIAKTMMIELNWAMGSTLAVVLVAISFVVIALSNLATRERVSSAKEEKA
ncbi:MAG: ABC transporter permease [Candidimonas sp.]|jgi:putative spermidine/putrescine transport system permease protein